MKKGQDKGQANMFKAYMDMLKTGGEPIVSYKETMNTSRASIAAIESMKNGNWIKI